MMPTGVGSHQTDLQFPAGFLWGVSTAAHQVEGNNDNQWAAWEKAGRIKSGDCCGIACDWWKNAERDFDLAHDLGVNSLRLSVEWSRVEQEEGCFSEPALRRYRQMLQALLERGIEPIVSLHHFANPCWFEQKGAFLSSDAPVLFERFSRRVVDALGDLCRLWVTFNEPNVYAAFGYVLGEFPPGKTGRVSTALRVIGAQARAHSRAYHAIHALQHNAQVGWAQHYVVFDPVNSGPDRWVAGLLNSIFNESFLQLIESGRLSFPFNLLDAAAPEAKGCCDFVGLNVYSRFHVAFDPWNAAQLFGKIFVPDHVPQGDPGMERPYGEAYPPAIRIAVQRAARLGKPIYILENGVPDAQDRLRPWLIVNALKELHALIQEGHDVRGYFHWTLTDNFEWTEGWNLRFGLVALDPKTQERSLRPSAYLYRDIARQNGFTPETVNAAYSEAVNP